MASNLDLVKRLFGSGFRISRWYIPGHDGIDLPAKHGTPIYAIASGRVSYARDARVDSNAAKHWAKYGGNVVNIDIDSRYTTQYAHLSRIVVKPGQVVKRGQLIGYVGDTGGQPNSPGARFGVSNSHLHFGLWDHTSNRMVNPTAYLTTQAATGGAAPDAGASLGAWGDAISFPVGHVITEADIDAMMKVLSEQGYFDAFGTGGVAYDITKATLRRVALGKPWNKELQLAIQTALMQDAENAGSVGGAADALGAIGDLAAKVADPANWVRILALGAGAIIFGVGALGVLRATGPSSSAIFRA